MMKWRRVWKPVNVTYVSSPSYRQASPVRYYGWDAFLPFWFRRTLGALLWWMPYGRCLRCRMPWKFVEGRSVQVRSWATDTGSAAEGVFVLCRACWQQTNVLQREIFHMIAAHKHGWPDIMEVVDAVRMEQ
jgi:hypothetical protein